MDMTFIEFLKASMVVIWIFVGFLIFFKDIMMVDVEETQSTSSTHTETTKIVEKIVYVKEEQKDITPKKPNISWWILFLQRFKKDPALKAQQQEALLKKRESKEAQKALLESERLKKQEEKAILEKQKQEEQAILEKQKHEAQVLQAQNKQANQQSAVSINDSEEEILEDENALESVIFFKKGIQVNKDFYEKLHPTLQKEFKSYFIDDSATHLKKELQYTVGQDNTAFFEKVFNYIYAYRHVISKELLETLHTELMRLGGSEAETQSLLYEAGSRVAYFRRKDKAMLGLAESWASQDVSLQQKVFKPRKKYVYSYARLAIILEKQGRIDEAIRLVEEAISWDLNDQTKGNYTERLNRLKGLKKSTSSPLKEATLKQAPIPEVVQSDDQLDQLDVNVMEDVQIFKHMPKARHEFYDTLTADEKKEFNTYFIESGKEHLVEGLQYVIKGNNDAFFNRVFNYIYAYRKTISLSLITKIYDELQFLADQDHQAKTLISEAGIRTLYFNRTKKGYLDQAKLWSQQDVLLHQNVLQSKNTYVYSVVRLAIILEKQGLIEEAITLVEDALKRQLDDRTKGNYTERLKRLMGLRKPVEEEAEDEDVNENDLENVQIFKNVIQERQGFYESLTKDEQSEFRSYFVDQGEKQLAKEIQYTIGKNNGDFFMRVFNYIYRYRKLISYGLLVKLSDELQSFSNGDPETQTLLYEAAIRVAYFRRKQVEFLDISQTWSQLDVTLHQEKLNSTQTYVYSFTRLAIILEKKKMYQEALALVEDALKRQLNDKTRTGYHGRKVRLIKKMGAVK